MSAAPRGKFITLEGGEGSGKSTQARLLVADLEAAGHDVLATREPGGSDGAEAVRRLLVEGEPGRWDGVAETLLIAAARRDHVEKSIRPALEAGQWVVCDRFTDSTLAYQGYAGGVDRALIDRLAEAACGTLRPDLTLVFDVPVEVGLARAAGRGSGEDRFERMGDGFHRRLRDGFLSIAAEETDRCVVIAADAAIDDVHTRVRGAVAERLAVPMP